MINSYANKLLKIFIILLSIVSLDSFAQTEQDALLMSQNKICVAGLVGYNSWTNYWEGNNKRDNANMGRVSTKTAMLMVNYGIKNNLNIIANVPFVKTQANQGTLAGMRGLQDIGIFLKWKPWQIESAQSMVSIFGVAGYSIPASNYNIDFLPMSIGLGSKVLSGRAIADIQVKKFTATLSGAYLRRNNVFLDRPAYYTDQQVNSSEVKMPDAGNFQFRAGYRGQQLIAEAIADNMTTFGGFDIRKNDMPFVSNRMNSTRIGLEAKYYLTKIAGLGFHAAGWHTLQGRNVGQASGFMAGASYILNLKNKIVIN